MDSRASKLNKLFGAILRGQQTVTIQNAPLFLEAMCAQSDPADCISRLIASKAGLASVQAAMRSNLSSAFLNGAATALLKYIQAPELVTIGRGDFLAQVVVKIVEPPIFWSPFTQAFRAKELQEDAQLCFAWLLLQLISLPGETANKYREFAEDPTLLNMLLTSSQLDTRTFGSKIKHIIAARGPGAAVDSEFGPGGRHDNDFVNFREITILPTADEIISIEPAFIRPSAQLEDPETEDTRVATYLDNQFRLLREDMLYEMREELQIALGKKKGQHRGLVLDGFKFLDIHWGKDDKNCRWGITLQCQNDPWFFKKVQPKDRKTYLTENRKILKHQSLACLIVDGEIVAFATVNRDEDLLAQIPPCIVLQLEGEASTTRALITIKTGKNIKLLQIDTPIFSYEPVLKALQNVQVVPLSSELLFWKEGGTIGCPLSQPRRLIQAITADPHQNLQPLLKTPRSILLDKSQAASLVAGLTQDVSLIQGPPGTGKSFIGALIAKVLHDLTEQTILVVTYTNHALDQFLEDLLDIGIPETSIVRLGGKSTPRTDPLTLQKQPSSFRLGRADWKVIDDLKHESSNYLARLKAAFSSYGSSNVRYQDISDHLEFEDISYYEAFRIPQTTDGMIQVGRRGRAIGPHYLLDQWANGWDAGIFKSHPRILNASDIWCMSPALRQDRLNQWEQEILKAQVADIYAVAKLYNQCQSRLERKFTEKDRAILASKRIIGCTTTAAAKYGNDIQAALPDVLLVEEAGEILESHVLAAMAANTTQLVLIGDHKQLRPKVNNYKLTVEKGEGYNLNRSLFERLVLKGYPHETLTDQHRMRPEISALIRQLTYPDLVDAAKTKNRAQLRGVQDVIVFINHDEPEDITPQLADRRDISSNSSKQNSHEVGMVLKIVRYLAQQGYGTDKIVILTPYLGQLHKLQEVLRKDNDPILNDLDSYDLVRAGLLPAASAKIKKKSIRLATIDNYQGEESDIVIASLTRSNADHDIGFMSSPQRLNVLLSRARDAMILIGNSDTFLNARKGGELWGQFFDLLKQGRHIYDGLPVRCERHPDRRAILSRPIDFDEECPDGGCKESCGTMLNCGLHTCPSKCHQLYDHSKMACEHIMSSKCSQGHDQSWKCHKTRPILCRKCERQAKLAEEKQKKEFALQQKRDADQQEHARRLAEIDEKIALERQALRDAQLAKERENVITRRQRELEEAASLAAHTLSTGHAIPQSSGVQSSIQAADAKTNPVPSYAEQNVLQTTTHAPVVKPSQPIPKSLSQNEWQRLKDTEGASNDSIDCIMEMIGLEEVKAQVLRIQSKIDVTRRQNASFKDERFNIVLLGNPGTGSIPVFIRDEAEGISLMHVSGIFVGKTTVARHYAKFLASLQVLPGNTFIETTGSRLANDGVPGIKKHVEEVVNGGGGAIFVDEAYQLASEHNFQGSQVLDFLLAEMENKVGTIVFILAGYNKQMEKFFEHNPGLTSRVPYRLQFADYKDDELLLMLEQQIAKRYSGRMKVEDGIQGLYGRIAVRRLGRGRGREGFGNARALQNMFQKVSERQAERLSQEGKKGLRSDPLLLLKEDLIGPDPSQAIGQTAAWTKLQALIGLEAVKESVRNQFRLLESNYKRELLEKEPMQTSFNRVLLGSPGTGKTTVAKLYGQILADLGLLSNGEVVVKNPADFIGAALGQSESNTKTILANTRGKVLVIDEAYMLYGGGGTGNQNDIYKTAVIDTMVAEIQSVPGDDQCVLLLGYKAQIEEMFQNVNPGLSRRFPLEDAFHFEDFTDSELLEIFNLKLKTQDLEATDAAKVVAIQVLGRARNRPNFGNGGEVENLLSQAKGRYQTRQASLASNERALDVVFEPQDFDPNFDRDARASDNLEKLFEDVVGCEDIIRKLGDYQRIARTTKARGMDTRDLIPTNFIFKGPPGTGKTTTARKMGQVYYDMGFLSSTEVMECSASDLIGQYVGQTGPKTKKVFERALGRVLFVDEAYRLGEGHFAKEAIDELVDILTQERFMSKVVVILAGYDQEMNQLMAVNTGLSSRFSEEVVFPNMTSPHCLELLNRELNKKRIQLDGLGDPSSLIYVEMKSMIEQLSSLPSWGNARDIKTLSKKMVNHVFKTASETSDSQLKLNREDAIACIHTMLMDRIERRANVPTSAFSKLQQEMLSADPPLPPAPPIHATHITTKPPAPPALAVKNATATTQLQPDGRDLGVTDEVWNQLQADIQAAEAASKTSEDAIQLAEKTLQEATIRENAQRELTKRLAQTRAIDAAAQDELKRQREQARLREYAAIVERERVAAMLEEKRKEEARQRQQEAKAQAALRQMGVCVAGFRWIKQPSGYRCAGGSHFVGNAALGI